MILMKRFLLVVALTLGVTGCYLPARFDAEINMTRQGYYDIVFEGYLADVQLFNDIQNKKISQKEEREKIKRLETDFKRDKSTKEFKYFKQGHFKVKWENSGDILKSKMVAFFRRNENLLSIRYNRLKSLVTIQGTPISNVNAKRLAEAGLGMQGQLRIKTDARVLSHNAEKVKKTFGREKTYIWNIKSVFDPSPKLSFQIR